MNVVGHGIDIVEIQRIETLLEQPEEHFLTRCFTVRERDVVEGGPMRAQYFAGRFAAKEAVLKALGTGWSQGIAWTDVEIERLPSGKPFVVLHARCKDVAMELGVEAWMLSISHTESYAIASVIALGSIAQ